MEEWPDSIESLRAMLYLVTFVCISNGCLKTVEKGQNHLENESVFASHATLILPSNCLWGLTLYTMPVSTNIVSIITLLIFLYRAASTAHTRKKNDETWKAVSLSAGYD